jgi:ATP-dependent DNA helicase RecG
MIASADAPSPTVLGLLVLGKLPRDHIPGAYLQFLRLGGNELTDPVVDELRVDGPVAGVIRRAEEKLESHNRVGVDFTSGPLEKRAALYPAAAFQQVLRNAVMHRSYEGTNAPVRVHWFDDRIEIISPGGPFGEVTASNFGTPGLADYRNPNLAEAMRALGLVQRFGAGIALARKALRDNGSPEPEFRIDPGFVTVVLRARR